ncbi:MAG: LacI family DNA-binding transcriptional regulator [Chloroflexota bacterium]
MAKTTIKDVARIAGVGVGTVSRVINNSNAVSDETRQKVKQAIEALNYQPNEMARRLSLGKTYTVSVLAPFFTRPAFVQRLRGLESVFAQSEYDFIIYNVDSAASRDKYFRQLSRPERTDGLLIMSIIPHKEHAERFLGSKVPTVLVDADHDAFTRVLIDDLNGGYKATNHLIELGHRKIGMVSDFLLETPFNYRSVFQRHEGYRTALKEAGIPFRPDYFLQCDVDKDAARETAVKLLTHPDPPTAIFAYSDTHAFGVLQAAEMLNINIPDDLSIVGYDDIELSEYLHLTTMRQSLFDAGAHGAKLLLNLITNQTEIIEKTVLASKLIERRTTAPPTSQ